MKNDAVVNSEALDETLVRWVLAQREDALRGNRHGELPGWAQGLDFLVRTGHARLLQVVADSEAVAGTAAIGRTLAVAA